MNKVRTECNRVRSMSVFQVPVTKSMKLEEFEQTQSQVSTQVCTKNIVSLQARKNKHKPFDYLSSLLIYKANTESIRVEMHTLIYF